MRLFPRLLLLFLLAMVSAFGASSLENARKAQTMLGAGAWSQVIRVENSSPKSSYPAVVYALVFEEAGLLWFYTDREGTQSLSLYTNRLAEEKENLGPLLQAIDAGFTRFTVLPDAVAASALVGDVSVPNGCFIESLAALHDRVLMGVRLERPRLLSCYANTRDGLRGHTVLTYVTPQGFYLLDPNHPAHPKLMSRALIEDPLSLASAALRGVRVTKARWIPLEVQTPAILATVNAASSTLSAENGAPRLMQ